MKTSKKTGEEEHGIGIKNILRIVEKYQGDYVIWHENGVFLFLFFFPSAKKVREPSGLYFQLHVPFLDNFFFTHPFRNGKGKDSREQYLDN